MINIQVIDNSDRAQFLSRRHLLTYRAWQETWQEEYKSLGAGEKLPSDNFTRQTQVLSIFVDQTCAALTFFHDVDLSNEMGRADSYFAPWPTDVLDQICEMDSRVLVCSSLTVSKAFRGAQFFDVPLKDLLAAASLYHFRRSDYALMVGNMRNSRKANELVYKFGAELLRTVDCNSEPSDLVLFRKATLPEFPKKIEDLIARSWTPENRMLKKSA